MKKIICTSFLFLYLIGCSEDPNNSLHTLSIVVSGKGNYEVSPLKNNYEDGETVTITAIADSGWKFNKWSGSVNTNKNPLHLTMDGNKSINLVFKVPFEPKLNGSWEGVQLPAIFHLQQASIFDSTIVGTMDAYDPNGGVIEFSVTGYNRVSVIILFCKKSGYYDITYTGWWADQSRINGGMREAGIYYKCDLAKMGDTPITGSKIQFVPKKINSKNE